MKYSKFIVLYLILDVFIIVSLAFAYLIGANGSVIIRNIPVTVVVIAAVTIGLQNLKFKHPVEVLGEVALIILTFIWYISATANSYDILASNVWFIQIVRGIILLAGLYILLDIIKKCVNTFVKNAQIFYVANSSENYSVLECFSGVIVRFKHSLGIPIFNHILRECAGEIIQKVQSLVTEHTEGQVAESIIGDLSKSKLVKASGWMLKYYTDYIDECVLMYCYCNPEKSMLRSSLEAIGIFFKQGVKIIEQMSVIIIIRTIVKVAILTGSIIAVIVMPSITIQSLLIVFIVFKVLDFIVQDAIMEPLMLNKVLITFAKCDQDENKLTEILEAFPILNKIKSLQSSGEPDDLETQCEESAVNGESIQEDKVVHKGLSGDDIFDEERETLL